MNLSSFTSSSVFISLAITDAQATPVLDRDLLLWRRAVVFAEGRPPDEVYTAPFRAVGFRVGDMLGGRRPTPCPSLLLRLTNEFYDNNSGPGRRYWALRV